MKMARRFKMATCKIYFDDGSDSVHVVATKDILEQMQRPKHKRSYTYGIEFSAVDRVEVV
jgi:hypothetical protein